VKTDLGSIAEEGRRLPSYRHTVLTKCWRLHLHTLARSVENTSTPKQLQCCC